MAVMSFVELVAAGATMAREIAKAREIGNIYQKIGMAIGVGAQFTAQGIATAAAIMGRGFQGGGIVDEGPGGTDRVPAALTRREMVLNRAQQAQLFAMANGAGGRGSMPNISVGGDQIVVQGSVDDAALGQIAETRERKLERVREMVRELQYNGELSFA